MAFLDNSGDILLDAVLTDTGRMRMARGDFKIVKFALGDDEINYGLFEANHTSGSAYQDLKILQTPIFEAFTNNTSVMKSKLMTIGRTNILYLPKVLLNTKESPMVASGTNKGTFVLIANKKLAEFNDGTKSMIQNPEPTGFLYGHGAPNFPGNSIILDQGIVDSNEDQDITAAIDPDLRETQFILKIDHRILRVSAPNLSPKKGADSKVVPGASSRRGRKTPVFIDDDHIAHYAFGMADTNYVASMPTITADDANNGTAETELVHKGPLGARFGFRLESSEAAKTSTSMYTKLGTVAGLTIAAANGGGNIASCDFIDTIARITGVTTGYSIDVPVRVVRNVNPS